MTGPDLFVAPAPYTGASIAFGVRTSIGQGATGTIATSGQIGLIIFDGTAGQRISIKWGTVQSSLQTSLYNPDGSQLIFFNWTGSNAFFDPITLPTTGTYALLLDPNGSATGTSTLTAIYNVPPDVATTTTIGGSPVSLAITAPGQNGRITFPATAGQRISIKWGTVQASLQTSLLNPDGSQLVSFNWTGSNQFFDTLTLPTTGTYTLFLNPNGAATGTSTLTKIHDVPADATTSTTIGGSPVSLTITVPGQNGRITFAGAANQRISIKWGTVQSSLQTSLLKPDGSQLVFFNWTGSNQFFDTLTLPVAGTYTLLLNPNGDAMGTSTLTKIHDVPADATTSTTIGGGPVSLTITVPGQNGRMTFPANAGQRISIKWGTVQSSLQTSLLKPDGSQLVFFNWTGSNQFFDTVTLPVAGTYTLLLNPNGEPIGTSTLTKIHDASLVTGAMTIGGPPLTLATTNPGQDIEVTFPGTAGQAITLVCNAVTIAGSDVSIRKPNGSNLVSPTYMTTSGKTINTTLPDTGTYTIVVNPRVENTGSVTFTLSIQSGQAPQSRSVAAADLEIPSGILARAVTPARGGDGLVADPPEDDFWIPNQRNLRGDWTSGRPASDLRPVASLAGEPGVTALYGRIVTLLGRPIAAVTVAVDDISTQTDAQGRFLLSDVPSGEHELWVDGRTVGNGRLYGTFEIGVEILPGLTNDLPYPIWLPKIDWGHAVRVPFPTTQEIVVTTPHIPGLELHIPAGARLTDEDGEPVTEVSITPIPVDRPPFPLPDHVSIPVYFTIQPGGAYVEPAGAWLVYPNYTNLAPGTRSTFWNYDPERGWHVYGWGTVTADGTQVVPDRSTRIYEFTGAMFGCALYRCSVPSTWPEDGDTDTDGDPVDLSTGLFVLNKTDLVLPDVLPVALTRTYRPGDTTSRAFGIGTSHPYELFLWSATPSSYQQVDLILPDGARIHYVRTSPGTGWADAVFEHTTTPGAFYGSMICWNGDGWDLELKDGTVYSFGDNAPLRYIADRYGNRISLIRNGGTTAQSPGSRAHTGAGSP